MEGVAALSAWTRRAYVFFPACAPVVTASGGRAGAPQLCRGSPPRPPASCWFLPGMGFPRLRARELLPTHELVCTTGPGGLTNSLR